MRIHDTGTRFFGLEHHGLKVLIATIADLERRAANFGMREQVLLQRIVAVVVPAIPGDILREVADNALEVAHLNNMIAVYIADSTKKTGKQYQYHFFVNFSRSFRSLRWMFYSRYFSLFEDLLSFHILKITSSRKMESEGRRYFSLKHF